MGGWRVANAQVNVTTQHNDIGRTGQNLSESVLTPSNVNATLFGKLFSYAVDGLVYAQPLYLSGILVNGTQHNVVFVATEHDSVFAFDADSPSGTGGGLLWSASMLSAAHGAAIGATTVPWPVGSDIDPEVGITGTPVIDSVSETLYVVSDTLEGGTKVLRLHALDVSSGSEKFGGPVTIGASVTGSGAGSVGGTLAFNSALENQRSGLLLLNGIVYIGFASHQDEGNWHGWILGYDATHLSQTGVYCTSPNGLGGGVWMSGAGLAADQLDPVNHPYGRMFVPTGNGDYNAALQDYGDSHLDLDLTNGVLTLTDEFTTNIQASLNTYDLDVDSGGLLVLPTQSAGNYPHLLVQAGKTGTIYLLNRDNLGGYHPSGDQALQELTAAVGGSGVWSSPAYWNGFVYYWGQYDKLKAFPLVNGRLSTTPNMSAETQGWPGATPSISANGTAQGIIWTVDTSGYANSTAAVVQAHAAGNVATTLYSSATNPSRDKAGTAVKFAVPTIANGKVYVGTAGEIDVYGLLPAPVPVFSPAAGTFTSTVTVSLTDTTVGAILYYTTDGSTPTTASAVYSSPIVVSATETVKAIAVVQGYGTSAVGSATYTIGAQPPPVVNYSSGFASAAGLSVVDGAKVTSGALELTDGGHSETTATWYSTPVNVQSFTTNFTFQISPASGDGFTFTIQNAGGNAVGSLGGGLGYAGIASSVAVKFDLFSNAGEGADSTGFYIDGAQPTVPALDMTSSGVNLHSGDIMAVQLAYDGTTLTLTITDTATSASFSASKLINIPAIVRGNTAHVGFTGGTGGLTAVQKILSWTYSPGSAGVTPVAATPTFSPVAGSYPVAQSVSLTDTTAGAILYYTSDGSTPTTASAVYSSPIVASATETVRAIAVAPGYASSAVGSATYTISAQAAATPIFSPVAGSYPVAQSVSLTDTTTGAILYYTTDGSTPTTASAVYSSPIVVSATETVKAIAVVQGYGTSAVGSATYTIGAQPPPVVNYSSGFASAAGLSLVDGAKVTSGALELTDGGHSETTATWYSTPVNVQSFTTNFTFQISPASGDGFTFTIQNAGGNAVGSLGGGLGYAGIASSVAVKFDLFSNAGEGADSTGFYIDGAQPTVPALDMTSSGVNLHSGDIMAVQLAYDGTTLTLTITDTATSASFSASKLINIPAIVRGNTAHVGFTGGTGGLTAVQKILSWTLSTP